MYVIIILSGEYVLHLGTADAVAKDKVGGYNLVASLGHVKRVDEIEMTVTVHWMFPVHQRWDGSWRLWMQKHPTKKSGEAYTDTIAVKDVLTDQYGLVAQVKMEKCTRLKGCFKIEKHCLKGKVREVVQTCLELRGGYCEWTNAAVTPSPKKKATA